MIDPQSPGWKTRLLEGRFPDRSFDIEFWQQQGDEAIFAAAWEMVELTEEIRTGRSNDFEIATRSLRRIPCFTYTERDTTQIAYCKGNPVRTQL
jgi:hypothetical protein